jgi:hypothetical protein
MEAQLFWILNFYYLFKLPRFKQRNCEFVEEDINISSFGLSRVYISLNGPRMLYTDVNSDILKIGRWAPYITMFQ